MRHLLSALCLAALVCSAPAIAHAADHTLTLKNHRFTPTELKVPANKRVKITVINKDATPEEFDSHDLKVEKVIPGNSKGVVRFGPLKPGKYSFMGEYHEDTAKGSVVAE